jgi:hypothetical protein
MTPSRRRPAGACGALTVAAALIPALALSQSAPARSAAAPREAATAIFEAFHTHSVVALTDAYGSERAHAFLISLIRDARFPSVVNDIVVEFGNARYQDAIDRFVAGEDVPADVLRRVWQDTTQPSAANDTPHAEAVFRAVRTVNAALPRERKVRVLLGDPPIDWDRIHTQQDHRKWIERREVFPASLIQVEVLARERRALLVYGLGHFQPRNVISNFDMTDWREQTIVSLIERAGPTHVFTIWTVSPDTLDAHQPGAASWPAPAVAAIRGTTLGAVDAADYFSWGGRFAMQGEQMIPVPREKWQSLPAEEQFDAVLSLGRSTDAQATWPPALCADRAYLEMRFKRIALAGIPSAEADRLKEYCASLQKP